MQRECWQLHGKGSVRQVDGGSAPLQQPTQQSAGPSSQSNFPQSTVRRVRLDHDEPSSVVIFDMTEQDELELETYAFVNMVEVFDMTACDSDLETCSSWGPEVNLRGDALCNEECGFHDTAVVRMVSSVDLHGSFPVSVILDSGADVSLLLWLSWTRDLQLRV